MTNPHALPPVPGSPFRALDHTANTGLWEGGLDEVRWGYPKGWLRSQVRRALFRRRGFQLLVSAPEGALFVSLRDEGLSGAARAVAWDPRTGARLGEAHAEGVPLRTLAVGPFAGEGTDAWLRAGAHGELLVSRPPGRSAWTWVARMGGLVIDVTVDAAGGAPALTAIDEAARRRPSLATSWNLLPAAGRVEAGGRELAIDGLASLLYTNSFAAPRRAFRVTGLGALPDGRRLGLTLTDGGRPEEVHERALFLDARVGTPGLHRLPRARILVGGKVERDSWRVRSPHGDCELKLRPLASDEEDVRRPRGRIHVHRVFGTLSGRVPLPDGTQAIVDGMPALAEDHRPA